MKKIKSLLFALIISGAFISCASTPAIPEDATATQLIQMGQDALELSNYKAAETYYLAVIQKYGTDMALYVEARYELGHLYLVQKKYDEAYTSFAEIQNIYAESEFGKIPGTYRKLSQLGMERLPEKYQKK